MINLPSVNQERLRITPGVRTVQSTPADFGGGIAVGLGHAADSADRASYILARAQRRKDADAADSAFVDYTKSLGGALNGQVLPDGTLKPGLKERKMAAADGVATDFARVEKEWMDNPEGVYSRLSPKQQKIFEEKADFYSARMREQAAGYEIGEKQKQRSLTLAVAAQSTAQIAADSYGTAQFDDFASEAALRAGDAAVGEQMQIDPDSGERVFASPEAQQAHELESEAALEKMRIGQSRYFIDKARETDIENTGEIEGFIASAEAGLDQLGPEAQTAVRNSIKDYRKSLKNQLEGRAIDQRQAQIEEQRAERSRLDELEQAQMLGGYQDLEPYYQALGESPESAYANAKIATAKNIEAARAREQSSAQKESLSEAQAENQRIAVNQLSLGAFLDPESGEVVQLSSYEQQVVANEAFRQGILSESQWRKAIDDTRKNQDQRVSQLSSQVLNKYMPDLALAVERDDYGNFTVSDKLNAKGKRLYSPADDSGIDRRWINDEAWFKNKEEDVYLNQVATVLNTVKTRLAVDKNMTVEQGAELFRKLIQGDLAEYNKVKLDRALQMENEQLGIIQSRLRKELLGGQK